ncbi:hypothetical protein CWR48_17735 [Oceanobacillus arenosus]|uniref:CTP synthase n=1 Tax=Oceanobacillus arenosus TaxID=1229153 RepID=A0A3D8PLA4_9BACI|nr:DUF6241 domain-containing protein [Oceanobacillus arenosus]RDW16029.1 hypothetical protein CWR48_17735 [Oceanobacillus arenosus]
MRKTLWIVIASVGTIVIGLFAYLLISDIYNGAAMDKADKHAQGKNDASLEELRTEIQGKITEEQLQQYKDEGLNPFGQKTGMTELTTDFYNEYIHGMSHQKVRAEKKWGYYEIHPDRVKWLLEGLDVVEIANETTYRDILERWDKGDFSRVDQDHNAIWQIQNGTVGKATGILSPGEEQEYIDSQ